MLREIIVVGHSVLLGISIIAYLYLYYWHNQRTRRHRIFIFHPYADAGGGGEKCLWAMIQQLVETSTKRIHQARADPTKFTSRQRRPLFITIFTHQRAPHVKSILANVEKHFGISIPIFIHNVTANVSESRNVAPLTDVVSLKIVRLHTAVLLFENYSFATQLLQLLAGYIVGIEAAFRSKGNRFDTIIDTQGVASAVVSFSWMTCQFRRRTLAYIHWPFVSPDLRQLAAAPLSSAKNPKNLLRRVYAKTVVTWYAACQWTFCSPILVNSTFTEQGMKAVWKRQARNVVRVYPPLTFPNKADMLPYERKKPIIVSLAQFRPEKNHVLQLEAIEYLLKTHDVPKETRFMICGSCRPHSQSDRDLVDCLVERAKRIKGVEARVYDHASDDEAPHATAKEVQDHLIEFHLNMPVREVHELLRIAKIGLHTMENEHLGISVAEFAANGMWVVAHRSGGPRDDILRSFSQKEVKEMGVDEESELSRFPVGCLCISKEEFGEGLWSGLQSATGGAGATAARLMRMRFSTDSRFGKILLDKWNI